MALLSQAAFAHAAAEPFVQGEKLPGLLPEGGVWSEVPCKWGKAVKFGLVSSFRKEEGSSPSGFGTQGEPTITSRKTGGDAWSKLGRSHVQRLRDARGK